MPIESFLFDTVEGRPVEGFTLSAGGLEATVIAHGARLVRMLVPGRDGSSDDVVLGFDRVADYLASDAYFGATCGRYGNRIGGAAFTLDGVRHELAVNEPPNQLHGGPEGFDRRIWDAKVDEAENAVTFTHESPDGDQGYPGTLTASTRYQLSDDGVLDIRMTATTDRPTIVNIVHHSYWNLGGHASGDLRDHRLTVRGGFTTPVGADLIPTGEVRPVGGTAFDLRGDMGRGGVELGEALEAVGGFGFDHNWCLEGPVGELRPVAVLEHPASGRRMELATDQPGLQVYSGGYLSEKIVGKGGQPYRRFAGLALESQRFPNSPNIGHFPSARLDPGETYRHRMRLRFRAD
ncbi:aldose epimerase [Azospirillum sp. TSH7]|uniref:aldose epimerase family protein n=1 Tax=unclassified Azospirillum TaxID=2630922 RepID=UPI000D60DBFE|nr:MULTISPECIES: aldose epimerase family protein [unclassified Azospirillum]PWC57702.1 aldose epimerase [Azospirillum sp. TSH20]PWC68470.1 aldose epimerase [Azospirillum sp. TSH7]